MSEHVCPKKHLTIAEAIRCAEANLGIASGQKLHPYWGTMKHNPTTIVGWQFSSRKRWRLDYDAAPAGKGPHVNEENFELEAPEAKTVHLIEPSSISGPLLVELQWKKWTTAGQVDK